MKYDPEAFKAALDTELGEIRDVLIAKNAAYGDAALNPLRIFAKGVSPETGILVRLDDKLSRIARGEAAGEDQVLDMLGYFLLLRITRRLG